MKNINTLINDDCIIALSKMDNDSVNHVITSPPYNRKRNDKYKNYNDKLEGVDYKKLLFDSIDECIRVSRGYVFYNIQKNYYNKKEVFDIFSKYSDMIVDVIVWGKNNPMPASGNSITNSYEFIFVFNKEGKALKSNDTYTKNLIMTSVYSKNPYKNIHKAVMNPEIVEFLVSKFTKENDVVLDCFMGTGTTGEVCIRNNRGFIGIEINEEYFKISENRLKLAS